MAVAHVVLDLPITTHFDYIIPDSMAALVKVGMRVRVSFGTRLETAFVVNVIESSSIKSLKTIKRLIDQQPILDEHDINVAREFAAYYGTSLGEALTSLYHDIAINRPITPIALRAPALALYEVVDGDYHKACKEVLDTIKNTSSKILIIVPDNSYARRLAVLKETKNILMVLRGGLHHVRLATHVIMIDDDHPSFAQEQTPMYHAREVLLMMARHYGSTISFIGRTPSVELKVLITDGKHKHGLIKNTAAAKTMVVDVSNYQQKGLLTPAALSALDASLKQGKRVLVYLNRRGNYAFTRCTTCDTAVTCGHCASSLVYERETNQLACRYCQTTIANKGLTCVKCGGGSFKSVGVGVNQLKNHLNKLFPTVNVGTYQHTIKPQSFPNDAVVVTTSAVLGFIGQVKVATSVIIDIDRELNRLDMRSSFNAWRLIEQLRTMSDLVIAQTRQPQQMMLQAQARDDRDMFYQQEIAIRRELLFTPFGHWIEVMVRSRLEKNAKEAADYMYNYLISATAGGIKVYPVEADAIYKKRDQYRFVVRIQTPQVIPAVACIKAAQQDKRFNRIITTIQVN